MRKSSLCIKECDNGYDFTYSTSSDQNGFLFSGIWGGYPLPLHKVSIQVLRNFYWAIYDKPFPGEDFLEVVEDGNIKYVRSDKYSSRLLTNSEMKLWSAMWKIVLMKQEDKMPTGQEME